MNSDDQTYALIALAVAYAPFIAAYGGWKRVNGGGIWKFLAFCFCTLAIAFVLPILGIPMLAPVAIVLWILAWVFAGLARYGASRQATADANLKAANATLKAIEHQNELLEAQQERSANKRKLQKLVTTLERQQGEDVVYVWDGR